MKSQAKTPAYNDNNLAIAYYRYSSHAQNDLSIDQQKEQAHTYADAHGLKIIKEYIDRAISGRTDNRPDFQLMLSEIKKLKPHALIVWKTDRLGRDRYNLALAKKAIRDAGTRIYYVAEVNTGDAPESVLLEGILESMSEFYSKQLRQNVIRGLRYNAEHCLFTGHRLLGYVVDETRHYIEDPATAPVVQKIFHDYADGKPLKAICNELNSAGVRTLRGKQFTINSLRHILHNRQYLGEYKYDDIVIPGGMPRLVSDDLFERVQERFRQNKRSPKPPQWDEAEHRYWLTGKLFCGLCGEPLHGLSGTGKSGKRWYYYSCNGKKRRNKCKLPNIRQEVIEKHVMWILSQLLADSENLASIAVDIANYYRKQDDNGAYLESLRKQERDVETSIANLIKALEAGAVSDTLTTRLNALETQKSALLDQIQAEETKVRITENDRSITHFFQKFANTRFSMNDMETAENILEYFVDKIFVYPDPLRLVFSFSCDCDPYGVCEEIELDTLEEVSEEAVTRQMSQTVPDSQEIMTVVKGSSPSYCVPPYAHRGSNS